MVRVLLCHCWPFPSGTDRDSPGNAERPSNRKPPVKKPRLPQNRAKSQELLGTVSVCHVYAWLHLFVCTFQKSVEGFAVFKVCYLENVWFRYQEGSCHYPFGILTLNFSRKTSDCINDDDCKSQFWSRIIWTPQSFRSKTDLTFWQFPGNTWFPYLTDGFSYTHKKKCTLHLWAKPVLCMVSMLQPLAQSKRSLQKNGYFSLKGWYAMEHRQRWGHSSLQTNIYDISFFLAIGYENTVPGSSAPKWTVELTWCCRGRVLPRQLWDAVLSEDKGVNRRGVGEADGLMETRAAQCGRDEHRFVNCWIVNPQTRTSIHQHTTPHL